MEKTKFLYFRSVTDMADDTGLIPGVGTTAAGRTIKVFPLSEAKHV